MIAPVFSFVILCIGMTISFHVRSERVMARIKPELEVGSLYILYMKSSGFWLDPVHCQL